MLKLPVMEDESTKKVLIIKANFKKVSLPVSEKKSIGKVITILGNGRTVSRMALAKKCSLMDCTTKDLGSEAKEKVSAELSVLMALFTMANLKKAIERELVLNFMEMAGTTMVNGLKINVMVKALTISNQVPFTKATMNMASVLAMVNTLG